MKRELNYVVKDQIATLTLARPKQLNALTSNLLEELADALEEANQDEEVRVIVLTGEGRGFCAGQDLKTVSPAIFGLSTRKRKCHSDSLISVLFRMRVPRISYLD